MKKLLLSGILLLALVLTGFSQNINESSAAAREHLLMDVGWKFNYGHFGHFENDFRSGTGYFTYFAKTGYGDGPATPNFDDRAWRWGARRGHLQGNSR